MEVVKTLNGTVMAFVSGTTPSSSPTPLHVHLNGKEYRVSLVCMTSNKFLSSTSLIQHLGMEQSVVVLVLLLALLPSCTPLTFLSIDCGATTKWEDPISISQWRLDDEYIKTGRNATISATTASLSLETLRYFPKGTKNCYTLPLEAQSKFLIRAGFFYGNYDSLSQPPTFNLEFDGNFWVTVTTSLGTDPIYHEVIYTPKQDSVSVCLNQTQKGQIPFISSLEIIYMNDNYKLMGNYTALYLEKRTNYGAEPTFPERFDALDDEYNRFWKPQQQLNYQNLYSGIDSRNYAMVENYPPYKVLNYAIRAQNLSDSIFLPIEFHEKTTPLSAYFVFYFYHVGQRPYYQTNVTKQIVSINGIEKNTTTVIPFEDCVVVSVYPVSIAAGRANVTISPAAGTTLPPILNAMEVFSTIEVPATSNSDPRLTVSAVFFYVFLHLSGFALWFS